EVEWRRPDSTDGRTPDAHELRANSLAKLRPVVRAGKLDVYARATVVHAWLVNPAAGTREGYRLDAGQWVRVGACGGDRVVHAVPIDVFGLDLLVASSSTARRGRVRARAVACRLRRRP